MSRPAPSILNWTGDLLLSEDMRGYLLGAGGPFELEDTTTATGQPIRCFAQRARDLTEHFRRCRDAHRDEPCLVFPDRTVNYDEVGSSIGVTACVLRDEFGVRRGDRVAIASANTLEYVISVWAIVSIGAISVGLNSWWTPSEHRDAIELVTPALVLTDSARADVTSLCARPPRQATWADLTAFTDAVPPEESEIPSDSGIDEDDPAVILFTSGTTGKAKGVTLTHRNLVNFGYVAAVTGAIGVLSSGVAVPAVQHAAFSVSPLFHISGFGPVFCMAPLLGSKLVFPAPVRWDERTHLELTQEHRVTSWSAVPTQYHRLFAYADYDNYDTSSVNNIGIGGATASPDLLRTIRRALPDARITSGYGMTETSGMGTFLSDAELAAAPSSVGSVIPGMQACIRDDSGNDLPEGECGQIHLRGSGQFAGYWNDPAATAATLDADNWYATGDHGRIENGLLYLDSRMRDIVIRGGENVYPIEIENTLRDHPDVADAAVVGVPHPHLGQEVAAVVVAEDGSTVTAEDIQDWVGQRHAKFKVPTVVRFRSSLPYSATGKILKRELEDDLSASPPSVVDKKN